MSIDTIIQGVVKLIRYGKNIKYCSMRGNKYARKGLRDLIDYIDTDRLLNIVEVGSYSGESAYEFLLTGKVGRIYCIDPWEDRKVSSDGNDYIEMHEVERFFEKRFANDSRVVKCKGTLNDYVNHCWDSIDLVYIDALHTYDACKEDIANALKYVRPRYIGGHDYSRDYAHTVGVILAVDEAFGKPDNVFCDTSWIKKIK